MVSLDITEPGPDENERDEHGILKSSPIYSQLESARPPAGQPEIKLLINQWVIEQEKANETKTLIAAAIVVLKTSVTVGGVTAKYTPGRYPRVTMIRRHPDV